MPRLLGLLAVLIAATLASVLAPAAAGAQSREPGRVLASEPLPRELWLPGTERALRMRYVTKGPQGERALSTGAVFLPEGDPPAGGWPVVAWAHGTVGIGDRCAPSVAGRSERDITFLREWLARGYAIVATDYVGLGTPGAHPYLDGVSEAYAVIDSVRAARRIVETLGPRWVVVGQSQGGQAALFTARLAPRYAPRSGFAGAVATGPASNLHTLTNVFDPSQPGGPGAELTAYVALIARGVQAARPGFDVDRYLTPRGRQLVADAGVYCFRELVERAEGLDTAEVLARRLDDRFARVLEDIHQPPTRGYERPVFIGQGTADLTVPQPLTEMLVADLREHGQPLTYRTYAGAGHNEGLLRSIADTPRFVARLLAAQPRLRIAVRPRTVRAGRAVRVRVQVHRVAAGASGLARDALVRVAGVRARTDRRGQAVLTVRPRGAGRVVVQVAADGARGRATLRVLGAPRFTG